MAELEPCRVCGVVPGLAWRWGSAGDRFAAAHECDGPYHTTEAEAAAEWNAAQRSPDLAAIRAAVEAERAAARRWASAPHGDDRWSALAEVNALAGATDALLGGGE